MSALIISFPNSRQRTVVDGKTIAFATLDQIELHLRESLEWSDPTLLIRAVAGIACELLSESFTQTAAVADGWASLPIARQRGLHMLSIVAALPAAIRASQ